MKKIILPILILPFLSLAKLEISLPGVIEVTQKSEYRLYDLAQLKEGTPEDLEKLKMVIVSDLSKKGILEAVKESNIKIKFIFEDSFKVTTTTQINKAELLRKISNHLTAECNTCIFEIQISKLPFVNNSTMNFNAAEFELKKGSFMLPLVDAAAESIQSNRFFASGTWKVFKKVIVANKWMGQGYRLTADDLKEELKDITYINDKLLDRQDLIGKQIIRAISVNAIFTRDLLIVEKFIKKGDFVRLLVKDGPFEIEMNAQAESDGLEGDSIKVKANQKFITAKVISKDKVVSE